MAYVEPGSVLPLVVQRFRQALESSTATHQLSTSITTLAMCVRPMLLAGWGLPEEPCAQVGTQLGPGRAARCPHAHLHTCTPAHCPCLPVCPCAARPRLPMPGLAELARRHSQAHRWPEQPRQPCHPPTAPALPPLAPRSCWRRR
jgi:hypothetical protein